MPKLDPQRPYATVHGHAASFEQDGVLFDAAGEQWIAPAAVVDEHDPSAAPAETPRRAPRTRSKT